MGKPVVRLAIPRSRREGGEERGAGQLKGARRGPGLARRTFPVNGERRPRASIQSGRETTLGPRVVHYSLRCPSLLPSSLFSAARRAGEFSSPFSPGLTKPIFSSLFFVLRCSPLLSFILSLLLPSLLLCVGYYRLQNLMMYRISFSLSIIFYSPYKLSSYSLEKIIFIEKSPIYRFIIYHFDL